jgi:hypothetical protein
VVTQVTAPEPRDLSAWARQKTNTELASALDLLARGAPQQPVFEQQVAILRESAHRLRESVVDEHFTLTIVTPDGSTDVTVGSLESVANFERSYSGDGYAVVRAGHRTLGRVPLTPDEQQRLRAMRAD